MEPTFQPDYRNLARGYGLGSGNSIQGYVPVEGFLAMVDAVKVIRRLEQREGTA
jgi:uroporphyrinogen decarboxylase